MHKQEKKVTQKLFAKDIEYYLDMLQEPSVDAIKLFNEKKDAMVAVLPIEEYEQMVIKKAIYEEIKKEEKKDDAVYRS